MVFIPLPLCYAEGPTELDKGTRIGRQRSGTPATLHFLQPWPGLSPLSSRTGVPGQAPKQLAEIYRDKHRSERLLFQIVAFWQMAKMNNRKLAFWTRGRIYISGVVCCLGAVCSDCGGILWWLAPAGICHFQAHSQGSCGVLAVVLSLGFIYLISPLRSCYLVWSPFLSF